MKRLIAILALCAVVAPAAAQNTDCTLIMPAHPLTAAGLATPYQLTATDPAKGPCNQANTAQSAFVQAAVIDRATGQISVYSPLVIDAGTQPAAPPVVPVLPAVVVAVVLLLEEPGRRPLDQRAVCAATLSGLRMAAAGALEPADQHVVGGVQEEDADPVAPGDETVDGGEHVVQVASAPAHHERDPFHLGAGPVDQLRHLGDQGGRHVVDDEPSQVLEGGGRR